jgi:hypothetical protein
MERESQKGRNILSTTKFKQIAIDFQQDIRKMHWSAIGNRYNSQFGEVDENESYTRLSAGLPERSSF